MTRLVLLLLALSAIPAWADSEMLSCQTVNGRTTCVHASGNVQCNTINGDTECTRLEDGEQLQPLPRIDIPGVEISRDGDRLVVRSGQTQVVTPGGAP